MTTDKQIRSYRDNLPLFPFDYDAQLTIKIALGEREPHKDMSKQQARKLVEQAIAKRKTP